MKSFYHILFFLLGAQAAPLPKTDSPSVSASTPTFKATAFSPKAKSFTELGVATDSFLNRDSCGTAKFGNRALWTCRDTQFNGADGLPQDGLFSSSASWSDGQVDGSQPLPSGSLRLYGNQDGKSFFPLQPDECNSGEAGECGDNTRFAIWPDSPPLVAKTGQDGSVTAYTWIRKFHIRDDFSTFAPDPATTLYRIDYKPGGAQDQAPSISVVNNNFWAENDISYGSFGNFVSNGFAYLYGQPSNKNVALARVPVDGIEDQSKYEYYLNGGWTKNKPGKDDSSANIPNVSAGGQGTYYYSDVWKQYVWIGQAANSVSAEFFITTSPAPEGPWFQPTSFYKGQSGNFYLGAYSLQAHPALVRDGKNEMIISYTKNDLVNNKNVYTTPLINVVWE